MLKVPQMPPEQHIEAAISHFIEARMTMTHWAASQYIRANVDELGSSGFLKGISELIAQAVEEYKGDLRAGRSVIDIQAE
jgi:hypothetical protein